VTDGMHHHSGLVRAHRAQILTLLLLVIAGLAGMHVLSSPGAEHSSMIMVSVAPATHGTSDTAMSMPAADATSVQSGSITAITPSKDQQGMPGGMVDCLPFAASAIALLAAALLWVARHRRAVLAAGQPHAPPTSAVLWRLVADRRERPPRFALCVIRT